MSATMLTTGKAARLCSVKPDTVLKWIKKGRLPASRTAGGHYRVEERALTSLLSDNEQPGNGSNGSGTLCSRPMRCWEYMNHDPGDACRDCVVHRVRATWCFRLANVVRGSGHAKRFCNGVCQECPYYRRVHGLPSNVLVITRDEGLIQDLARRSSKKIWSSPFGSSKCPVSHGTAVFMASRLTRTDTRCAVPACSTFMFGLFREIDADPRRELGISRQHHGVV